MPKSTQSLQSTTKARKGLLQYNLAHGSVSMKRHPLNEHLEEFAKYKIKSKSFKGGGNRGRSACKKQKVVYPLAIIDFWGGKGGYQKMVHFNSNLLNTLFFHCERPRNIVFIYAISLVLFYYYFNNFGELEEEMIIGSSYSWIG
jgi:hypothetical protein